LLFHQALWGRHWPGGDGQWTIRRGMAILTDMQGIEQVQAAPEVHHLVMKGHRT
jgi:hypothetical protein